MKTAHTVCNSYGNHLIVCAVTVTDSSSVFFWPHPLLLIFTISGWYFLCFISSPLDCSPVFSQGNNLDSLKGKH